MMEEIQYRGADKLNDSEKITLNKLAPEYYDKIKRSLNNLISLQVEIKLYKKAGGKRKYDVHAKVVAPTTIFSTSYADWDFARTLHKVFKKMEREILHKLK